MLRAPHIPMALRSAYLSMHRQTNAHLTPLGITADQFVCLIILTEEEGITQQELVKRTTSDPNTILAMLVLLEKRGLVQRKQHPAYGRARCVTITNEGRRLVEKLDIAVKPVQQRLSALFQEKEINILIEFLNKISGEMKK
jgi:DNA-binding MarR family transcriptional regulator